MQTTLLHLSKVCFNLNTNHAPLLDIYRSVDAIPGIKKSFIGSGIRYDMLLQEGDDTTDRNSAQSYLREVITRHVSGD